MRIIKLYNNTDSEQVWGGIAVDTASYSEPLSSFDLEILKENQKVNQDMWSEPVKLIINDGDNDLSCSEGSAYLKGDCTKITEIPPFAAPDYRTKDNATPSILTIEANSTGTIDFPIASELYVSGGDLIIENALLGDYVTAEVRDIDNLIPEAFREALCEDHPTVAKYIEKKWICPIHGCSIDTRPLNAKISQGLYLRVTYTAIDSGSDRKLGVNYRLTKKL